MVLPSFVGLQYVSGFFLQPVEQPPIDVLQLIGPEHVGFWIEIPEVSKHEPDGVSDLSIGINELIEYLLGDANINGIIGRHGPEPDDICSVLLYYLLRCNGISQGLAHLFALTIDCKAVGENCPVRRVASGSHGRKE